MMAVFQFQKADKLQRKARIALIGPSGSGKTYTGLAIASGMGDNIAVIDTENYSSTLYADKFNFSVLGLDTFGPETYIEAIHAAERAGFDVLIIDSLSHAWMGKDGALEQVDKAARRYGNNSYAAWRDVTPKHNALVDAMIRCKCHLIVTMRAKTEYVINKDEKGKTVVNKVGLAPVQRDGLEYEFDFVADMDWDNNLIESKTRWPSLKGAVINKPGPELGKQIVAWLSAGDPTPEPQPISTASQPQPKPPAKPTPNTTDSDNVRKRFFAVAKELGVSSEIAKEWAKQAFSKKPVASFNDIPVAPLSKTVDAMADPKRSKAFVNAVTTWYRIKLLTDAANYCGDEAGAREWMQVVVGKVPEEATVEELGRFNEELLKATEPPKEEVEQIAIPS